MCKHCVDWVATLLSWASAFDGCLQPLNVTCLSIKGLHNHFPFLSLCRYLCMCKLVCILQTHFHRVPYILKRHWCAFLYGAEARSVAARARQPSGTYTSLGNVPSNSFCPTCVRIDLPRGGNKLYLSLMQFTWCILVKMNIHRRMLNSLDVGLGAAKAVD